MGKNKVIGKCALCGDDNVELQNSHIIPKLVYKRMKCYDNSRFRNYYSINDIYQDGEKKYILCEKCEKFFSKFEVSFTDKFLDKYIRKGIKLNKNIYAQEDFIYSLSWRIVYDDLYILNSFEDKLISREYFCVMEEKLRIYLKSKLQNKDTKGLDEVKNYIFFIDEFDLDESIINLLSKGCFGYCFTSDMDRKYTVMTCFLGVVCVTLYEPKKLFVMGMGVGYILRKFGENSIYEIIKKELVYQYNNMLKHKSNNDKMLASGLEKKIRDRYKK